jgi:adenosylmethionine-8-amino-7-oxononanoate aminotransferase
MALNIARRRWKALGYPEKTVSLSLDRSYHGNLGQAKLVTGFEPFKIDSHIATDDFVYISSARNAETGELYTLSEIKQQIENTVEKIGKDRIACLFVEPVNFAGGVIIPPKGYLKLLRKLCDKHHITLIVDEVITGFGRTGAWFAFQHEEIRPDMVTLGKGITAGYFPLAAVAVENYIYEDLIRLKVPLKMVITMAGHPTGCSIALKAIEIVERDNLRDKVELNEQTIFCKFNKIKEQPILQDIRGFGHMWGLEFCDFNGYLAADIANKVALDCQKNGCIVAAADGIIRINPPLNMSSGECDMMTEVIVKAISNIVALIKTN